MLFRTSGLISFLALANVAYCARLPKNQNSSSQWDCQKVPDDKIVGLGSGLQSTYCPYYVKDQNSTSSVELFSSSGRHCSLHFKAIGPQHETYYDIYQASTTALYLRESDANQRIIRVDMSTCTSKELYKTVDGKRSGEEWGFPENMIHYESGNDEIIEKNSSRFRVSYDQDGNQIGQPKVFHLDYMPSWVKPISPNSRSSNLVVDYYEQGPNVKTIKRFLSLVDADGRLVKQLLKFEFEGYSEFVDDVGDSSYAYCRRVPQVYNNGFPDTTECVQFDVLGNEKYRNTTETGFRLIAVFNLKEGGVVLFTGTYGKNGEQLNVIEMLPGEVRDSSYAFARDFSGNIFVTNFSEVDRRFSVRTESTLPVTSEYRICRNNFSLTNENE